jgi:transcriptional regulator with XRE-family HTH domain
MSQDELSINGDLLRLRREARGWALSDMAIRACMSVKQIRQLEEGGMSSFYSPAVKATAAKKVGGLLGISVDEVFGHASQEAYVESVPQDSTTPVEPVSAVQDVMIELSETASAPDEEPVVLTQSEEKKSKTSLWVIAGLFAAALAVAAYMQQQEEPAAEPAPPLQTVPSDAVDAASTAELPASNASSVEVSVSTPQKSASGLTASAAPVASAVRPTSVSSASAAPVAPASKAAP